MPAFQCPDRPPLCGLYPITSEALCRAPERLLPDVEAVLASGARLLQYRDKWNEPQRRLELARALRACCRAHGALLIINDDPELAFAVQADGVHLGQRDTALAQARARLGARALIGVSCANRLDHARVAQRAGADYVAFGRFFPSRTKPEAPAAEPALLEAARAELGLPICAIGGILPGHVPTLRAAGADLIAVVDGLFGQADVAAAAAAYTAGFAAAR